MCLMVFAWRSHPDYPLVLAANRDEFYLRRTRPAAWWGQAVSVLAGHDEEAGGTWLGITRRGRFAALTNVRAPSERNPHAPSRGTLVLSALQSSEPPATWLESNAARMSAYNGFNLLLGDVGPVANTDTATEPRLDYFTNRSGAAARTLAPGIYGLSNAALDTPWPKVTRAVTRFACSIASRVDLELLITPSRESRTRARRRASVDRGSVRMGTRAFVYPDSRQRLRYASQHRTNRAQRWTDDILRAHLRHDRSAALFRPAL